MWQSLFCVSLSLTLKREVVDAWHFTYADAVVFVNFLRNGGSDQKTCFFIKRAY